MKKYNYNTQDVFGTHHYYIDMRVNNESNITDYDSFESNRSVKYGPDECTLTPTGSNSTHWSCQTEGYYINSTHYTWFKRPIYCANSTYCEVPLSSGGQIVAPYYGIAGRALKDSGNAFTNYSENNAWARRAIADMQINDVNFINVEPTKYNESSTHTFYDGDAVRLYFNFTNTGESVNDYNVRLTDYVVNVTNYYYYDVQPGETIYFEQNFTIEANCTAANVSSTYCPTDDTIRYYNWWFNLYPNQNLETARSSYSDLSMSIKKGYDFTEHVNITYIPTSGSPFSDYMKVKTDITANPHELRWFSYNITWLLDTSYSPSGSLVVNDTVSSFDDGIDMSGEPAEYNNYYCGDSDCYIPLVEGNGGSTYHQYWNFRATSCYNTGSPYTSRYEFNITAGNHDHDLKKISVTQDDRC